MLRGAAEIVTVLHQATIIPLVYGPSPFSYVASSGTGGCGFPSSDAIHRACQDGRRCDSLHCPLPDSSAVALARLPQSTIGPTPTQQEFVQQLLTLCAADCQVQELVLKFV